MKYLPSLACARQLHLAEEITALLEIGLTEIHFDMMDGHYVPNFCLHFDLGMQLKQTFSNVTLDVHLMAERPEAYVERIAEMGAGSLSFHLNANPFAVRLLGKIREHGMRAGIVLNPSQPVSLLQPVLPFVDDVLLMSVEPGFAGQLFLDGSFSRLQELVNIRCAEGASFKISLDGGITPAIAAKLEALGADRIVLGYPYIFNQPDGIIGAWERGRREQEESFAKK